MTWDALSGVSISHTGRCLCDLNELIDGHSAVKSVLRKVNLDIH